MQLPGARSFSPLSLFALLALCLSSVSAVVIGIDLGTEYIKAAFIGPGIPLDIVLTKDSRRKEAAAINFKPVGQKSSFEKGVLPERNYGADALALSARFPGDTFQNLKSLLGVPFTNPAVAKFQERYPGVQIVAEEDNTIALKSSTFEDGEQPFLVEELLAMELQNVAGNAAKVAGQKIKDVIITIPAYWTVEEKDAVRRAADLANLNVMGLMTDGLAVGYHYATRNTFPVVNEPGKNNKPEFHIVYDMGAGGTSATVLRMQGRTVKDVGKYNKTVQEVQVLGVGWDSTLGGDALNTVILNDMIDKLVDMPTLKVLGTTREQVAKDGRTISKLWSQAEKLRQVLSANSETQASFEGIFNEDVSFKYKLKRPEYEKLVEDFVGRVKSPIDQAMHTARLEFSDIESIIVHGGAQRTPFVQKVLESWLSKDKIRNVVNSDEAAVFGAAFLGATRSSSFKVMKEIRPIEAAVHDVWVSWTQDGKERNQKIFTESSASGKAKQLPFKTAAEELNFEIYQQVLDGADMRNIPVWAVKTTNMTKAVSQLSEKCAIADIKTQFEVWMTPSDNLPDVVRGTLSCEVIDDKKSGIVDGIKGFFGGKKDDQQVLKDGEDSTETVSTSSSSSSKKGSKASGTASASDAAKESKEPKKRTEIVYVGVLTDSTARKQMSHMEMMRIRDRLSTFKKSDSNREKRAEALNQLEGYAYKIRDLLDNESFMAVSTEAIRASIAEKASAASEWIYGDGSNADRSELEKRLAELKDLVTPIEKRRTETAGRPEALEMLEKSLNSTVSLLDTLKASAEESIKEAASKAEAAASAVTSAVSSAVEGDDPDDLDDEPSTTSSSETSIPTSIWKLEDFDTPYEKVEKTKEWLKEVLAAQAKLLPSDDAAFSVAELKAKANEVSKITSELLQKSLRAAQQEKKVKSKTSSSKASSKTAKGKKVIMSPGSSTTVGDAEASSSKKDEL